MHDMDTAAGEMRSPELDDFDLPYAVMLTIPMPGKQSAEDLATAYRMEWAECPDVTVEVHAVHTASRPSRRKEET
jgi:hypothetical protein